MLKPGQCPTQGKANTFAAGNAIQDRFKEFLRPTVVWATKIMAVAPPRTNSTFQPVADRTKREGDGDDREGRRVFRKRPDCALKRTLADRLAYDRNSPTYDIRWLIRAFRAKAGS